MVMAMIALSLASSGCVQRRMTIRSNPPGALVYVDDYAIGNTPVSASFTYYGTRKIRLVKDGYETLTVMQKFSTPWYQYVPLDFISENLVPGKISDRRVLDFQLKPQMVVPLEHLQARAEELRRNTRGSMATPLMPPGSVFPQPQLQPQPVLPNGNIPPEFLQPSTSSPANPEMLAVPPGIGGQPVRTVQP
jgi:hypothetical protein